jgi:nicotinamide-nucleotide amidase
VRIEWVSIGNERLLGMGSERGETLLWRQLSRGGYSLFRHADVAEMPREIRAELSQALERSRVVMVTLRSLAEAHIKEAFEGLFWGDAREIASSEWGALLCYTIGEKRVFILSGEGHERARLFAEFLLPWLKRHVRPARQFVGAFSLALCQKQEVAQFIADLQVSDPDIEVGLYASLATQAIVLRSDRPLDRALRGWEEAFATHWFLEERIEEALHRVLMAARKRLALAESCTGGAVAARLTALPGASLYLQGAIVAYSNLWKERFLHVSPTLLQSVGAVNVAVIHAMIEGLFQETDADYALAISGLAGPSKGGEDLPVGTIYIGVGQRGERSDIGKIMAPPDRSVAIEMAVETALAALWRRIVHRATSFS